MSRSTHLNASSTLISNASTRPRLRARRSCNDETFAEASFYIGLIQWQQGNFESALATLRPLADDLKLTSVYNALGAIAVAASRSEKKNPAKAAALLTEGIGLLRKASESAPDDANIRFNYGATLFLSENYGEAAASSETPSPPARVTAMRIICWPRPSKFSKIRLPYRSTTRHANI
ncbi:MAG: hypothetical protein IPK01_16485 [Acidobacteria bacterium]|nr:hypothetical protein [Acidobacteriota bacterium]